MTVQATVLLNTSQLKKGRCTSKVVEKQEYAFHNARNPILNVLRAILSYNSHNDIKNTAIISYNVYNDSYLQPLPYT